MSTFLPVYLIKHHVAGYSTTQGPSSPLVRPHPAVWKLIHGVIVLYLMSLIFLLFQSAHDARQLLKVKFVKKHTVSALLHRHATLFGSQDGIYVQHAMLRMHVMHRNVMCYQ